MSTDSRYSPNRSAIAVPPPNRQLWERSSSASSASSTAATRRWWVRSNKQPASAEGFREAPDEVPFLRRHRFAIDVPPIALVKLQRLLRRQLRIIFHLPGEPPELRVVRDRDRRRQPPRRLQRAFAAMTRIEDFQREADRGGDAHPGAHCHCGLAAFDAVERDA